jgi:hypothetical protein
MEPAMMGDGDVLGDGQLGAPGTDAQGDAAVSAEQLQAEQEIRNTLVTEAYGTNIPQRRTVDKE